MSRKREYKGFLIEASAEKISRGGYVASVTLTRHDSSNATANKFDLPPQADLTSEEDALQQAMQYGLDLVDGLVGWFDPDSMRS